MPSSSIQQAREELKKQLRALLLTRPYDPDKLPRLPGQGATTTHATHCEYSEFLRIEPLRTDIVSEWRRRCTRDPKPGRKRERGALLDGARRFSALLRRAEAASLKSQLAEALRDFYLSNKAEAAPEAEIFPKGPDGKALHEQILSDSLVRLHVQQDREALWQVSPDNPHRLHELSPDEWRRRIAVTAQERAVWLVDTYVPAQRRRAGAQTDWLLGQLRAIFGRPFDPDILPPLPGPDTATGHAACEYSAILRIEPLRTDILSEWRRLSEPEGTKPQRRASSFNALLRKAAGYLSDTWLFDVVQLSKSALRTERNAKRQELARALCGAEEIKVRALRNTKWNRKDITVGECFRLPSLVFLTAAHEWALSPHRDCEANRRRQTRPRRIDAAPPRLQKKPIYEPADKSSASRRAQTCWRILELLGDARLNRGHDHENARLSLSVIVEKITGRKDGPRYRQISDMVERLRLCSFVDVESLPLANGKTEKRISILKDPPRIY